MFSEAKQLSAVVQGDWGESNWKRNGVSWDLEAQTLDLPVLKSFGGTKRPSNQLCQGTAHVLHRFSVGEVLMFVL